MFPLAEQRREYLSERDNTTPPTQHEKATRQSRLKSVLRRVFTKFAFFGRQLIATKPENGVDSWTKVKVCCWGKGALLRARSNKSEGFVRFKGKRRGPESVCEVRSNICPKVRQT